MTKVMLDPGHGGRDPGAVGPQGAREKDITLAVARRAAAILATVVQVKLTREADVELGAEQNSDLAARVKLCNDWGAERFVSIHCNSSGNRSAHGTETYCLRLGGDGERLARSLQSKCLQLLGLSDRGVKTANYYVLRRTNCPAVLIELAFVSNPAEEALLVSADFQQKCAQAIAWGIGEHLGIKFSAPVTGQDVIKIIIGSTVINGVIIQDVAYAPVRSLAEALGKRVEWNPADRSVVIT